MFAFMVHSLAVPSAKLQNSSSSPAWRGFSSPDATLNALCHGSMVRVAAQKTTEAVCQLD